MKKRIKNKITLPLTKKMIIPVIAILFMAICYAADTANIFIDGTLGLENAMYNVRFTNVNIGGNNLASSTVAADGQSFTYTIAGSSTSKIQVFYEVSNIGMNYDALTHITCNATPNTASWKNMFDEESSVKANTIRVGSIFVYGGSEVTCSLSAEKQERTDLASSELIDENNYLKVGNSSTTSFLGKTLTKSKVESITFNNTTEIPEGATVLGDVSDQQNGSIIAYTLDENSNSMLELYIGQDGGVNANPNSSYLFTAFYKVTEFKNMENFHTDLVMSMKQMFYADSHNASALKSIDLTHFNTTRCLDMSYMFAGYENPASHKSNSLVDIYTDNLDVHNVMDMSYLFCLCSNMTVLRMDNWDISSVVTTEGMFKYCSGLTAIDLSCFDTSKTTNMSYMFDSCINLSNLDLKPLDTRKVTNMSYMFSNCTALASIDLSNINTSNVITMKGLFYESRKLTSLNLSKFDTSKVTDMSYMFAGYFKTNPMLVLEIIGLSDLDTSNVKNMSNMFKYSCKLTELDLSNWNTSQVTNMAAMFYGCTGLMTLDISHLDTRNVTSMSYMFYDCSSLATLDVSGFDTSNVENMSAMFSGSSNFTMLDVSHFDTSKVTNMEIMFNNCSNLTTLDLANFDTSNLTAMSEMFYGCSNLATLDISNFDTSNIVSMTRIFYKCKNLTTLDLTNFNTSNVTSMYETFCGCSNLTSLDVSKWNTSNVTSMYCMFSGCSSLNSLNISSWDTSNVTSMSYMFCDCRKLTTTITIRGTNCTNYGSMFYSSATEEGAQITVDYTEEASDLVDKMIVTKSDTSNVVKGNNMSTLLITIQGDNIVANVAKGYEGQIITLSSTEENKVVSSFKLNGTLVEGNTFTMPAENVTITDVVTVTATIIESEHNPYANNINNQVMGEETFEGATSLTVTLDYQTESTSYDWIYLYDSTGKQYGKYGGSTRKTETITIQGNYVKVVFKTDSSGNNYYGFKATIIPNYE